MKRLLLFDVDGTLVDVAGAGREALRHALLEVYGKTGPIGDFDFHGKTDPAIVRGLLRAAGVEHGDVDRGMPRVWSRYLQRLPAELRARRDSIGPCAGVEALLARLDGDARFALGLVTGNVRDGAWRKLESCGLRSYFTVGAFGSDSEMRDELPPIALERARERFGRAFRPEEVWVVGDTPADVQCGLRSGLRTLAVATGRHGVDALREHGAERTVESFADADAVIGSLIA